MGALVWVKRLPSLNGHNLVQVDLILKNLADSESLNINFEMLFYEEHNWGVIFGLKNTIEKRMRDINKKPPNQ